ncbi:hypothetical protein [Chromobacterium sp. ASV23]|uniref:hypothetical protein n=1 Tax=Chromobacterium sp. ASV23 TaxID=2795110 RepID=UPI0018ED815F|nr:hypothetical protein [Chromobacterium sp. ASV23]
MGKGNVFGVRFERLIILSFAIIFWFFGFLLLRAGQLSGGEFVSYLALVSAVGFVLVFLNDVQEISIVGNVVKLREVRIEAEAVVSDLKELRLIVFRGLLQESLKFGGGLATISPIDYRSERFVSVCEDIKRMGLVEVLSGEILKHLKVVLYGQCAALKNYQVGINGWCGFDDFDLSGLVPKMDAEKVVSSLDVMPRVDKNEFEVKEEIKMGISYYNKLMHIYWLCMAGSERGR